MRPDDRPQPGRRALLAAVLGVGAAGLASTQRTSRYEKLLVSRPVIPLGRDIGYVPQTIEMVDGTIAQNIARFDPAAEPEAIIAAAREADVHDMIVSLPGGYDYALGGPGGGGLSAGQKQRLALARALYGNPFLLVLDEPNSNLDAVGEAALAEAVRKAKERGAIVVIVGHRPSVFAHVEQVMLMADGQIRQMGERGEMLQRLNFKPAA